MNKKRLRSYDSFVYIKVYPKLKIQYIFQEQSWRHDHFQQEETYVAFDMTSEPATIIAIVKYYYLKYHSLGILRGDQI